MMYKVVALNVEFPSLEIERECFDKAGLEAELVRAEARSAEDVMNAVREADALMVQYEKIDEQIISSMKKCRLILRYGIGVDNVDLAAAGKKGIFVANVPDYGRQDVADHTLAMLLSLSRKLKFYDILIHKGLWGCAKAAPIHRLNTQTLGLIGFGGIARIEAEKAKALGMRVIAYDPFVEDERMRELGAEKAEDVAGVCAEADFIALHTALTPETRHIINDEFLSRMKSTAYLINTARGPLVDHDALVTALKSKQIAGAAIDVFDCEPIGEEDELLRLDNVILTPHAAYYSEEAIAALHVLAAEEVVRVLKGGEPRCFCNKQWFAV